MNILEQGPNKKVTIRKASCVVRQAELMSSMTQTIVLWSRRKWRWKLMQNMTTVNGDFMKQSRVGVFK